MQPSEILKESVQRMLSGGVLWEGRQVVSMRTCDIYPLAKVIDTRPEFQGELRFSMQRDGMQHPLLVAYATRRDLETMCGPVRKHYAERPPHPAIFIVVGCQRYALLKSLGFEHLPCVFFQSIDRARQMSKITLRDWRDRIQPSIQKGHAQPA